MRREDDVFHAAQRRVERFITAFRLNREDVQRRTGDMTTRQRFGEVANDYALAASGVNQHCARLHQIQFARADKIARPRRFRHMQADHVRLRQERVE